MARARRFGLTADEAARFIESRKGLCDICGNPATNAKGLHWDHDHKGGALRGLLCSPCNMGVGQFKDSPERLRAAAAYLERGAVDGLGGE